MGPYKTSPASHQISIRHRFDIHSLISSGERGEEGREEGGGEEEINGIRP